MTFRFYWVVSPQKEILIYAIYPNIWIDWHFILFWISLFKTHFMLKKYFFLVKAVLYWNLWYLSLLLSCSCCWKNHVYLPKTTNHTHFLSTPPIFCLNWWANQNVNAKQNLKPRPHGIPLIHKGFSLNLTRDITGLLCSTAGGLGKKDILEKLVENYLEWWKLIS